jgi:SAM-dependent methyltransferase
MDKASHLHRADEPSAWVRRWAPLIPRNGYVLDLACGSGRHSRFLTREGCRVEAVDRDPDALAELVRCPGVHVRQYDVEAAPWPYGNERFDAIVVTNYLHRPLFPYLLHCLASGGVLIYETFAEGHEKFGRPSNPDFLLRSGELLEVVRGRLHVIAYENVFVPEPRPAVVQRICATDQCVPFPARPEMG